MSVGRTYEFIEKHGKGLPSYRVMLYWHRTLVSTHESTSRYPLQKIIQDWMDGKPMPGLKGRKT